jgi:hypothetical protein
LNDHRSAEPEGENASSEADPVGNEAPSCHRRSSTVRASLRVGAEAKACTPPQTHLRCLGLLR